MNVLVDPPARGRGIARRLVVELLERTAKVGAGEGWTLEVRDANDAAIALYEHCGFEVAGRRPGYYADTGEDALVMWRRSDQGAVGPGVVRS
jgi:[ribosomal protein S18]-alanine N-acetyltransferase